MYRILQTGFTANYGGVEAVVMNWYRNIDRDKIQFDFLVSHKLDKIAYEDEILSLGGHIYREYYGRKEKPFTASKYIDKIFKNDSSIVGVHMNLNTIEYITPLTLAARRNLPVRIVHSHNSGNLNRKEKPETRAMQLLNKHIVQSNQYLKFGCSQMACDFMFGKKCETQVIHNAIDLDRFAYDSTARKRIRHELGVTPETTLLGFVGRLQYQKNPIFMLKVFETYLHSNFDAVLVMIGAGAMEDECKQYVEQHSLKERVLFLGMKSNVADYYSAFDLFLFPSLFEGLGVVLIEGQACALPCLISENIPEDVDLTDLVLRKSLNSPLREWADSIDLMVKRGKHARIMDTSGIRFSLESAGYSIPMEAKRLEDIYTKLIEGK